MSDAHTNELHISLLLFETFIGSMEPFKEQNRA